MMNSGQLRGAVGGIWVRQKTTRRGYSSLALGIPKRGKSNFIRICRYFFTFIHFLQEDPVPGSLELNRGVTIDV